MKLKFHYTENFFYKIWLIFCLFILLAAVSSGILVFVQVSNEVTNNMKERLLLEANYYRLQLNMVFIQASQKLNALVRSSAAFSGDHAILQKEMTTLLNSSSGIVRCWIAYPNGKLIPSTGTRLDYVRRLPWWDGYLAGQIPANYQGFMVGRGLSLVGKPNVNPFTGTTLVPLVSMEIDGIDIIRAAGAELDLNVILSDEAETNDNWTSLPISVYTEEGILVACPYLGNRNSLKLLNRVSDHPLIQEMIAQPKEDSGFKIYDKDHQQMAGYYLRNPSLGLVLLVEYPAAAVVNPVRRIAFGPLFIAVLLIFIVTIIGVTLYTFNKRLHQVEHLARAAEIRALQAHINPHFLNNTLDQLIGMVSTNPKATTEAIKSLGNLFRYATRQMEALVTLKEELTYLQEYVSLQKLRFGNRVFYELICAENLLQVRLFKFSIQPLVENCFVHGVEKSLDPVSIQIKIEPVSDGIMINVSDDGPGITPARLREINESLEKEAGESGKRDHGVGLSNIHFRFQYAYGSNYGLTLEPLEDGLTVHLKIPLLL